MDKPKIIIRLNKGKVEGVFTNFKDSINIDVEIQDCCSMTAYEKLDSDCDLLSNYRCIYECEK